MTATAVARRAGASRSPLDAALAYAGSGWAVLPVAGMDGGACSCGRACDSPGKHPLTRHGVHDATTDAAHLRRWWRRWPGANVGVATGTRSALTVVDVDVHRGGRESLAALHALGYVVPSTLLAYTGGGGFHLYYRQPANIYEPNTVDRLPNVAQPLPGIDLRGDGGYVVAAPSLHASGARYRWRRAQPARLAVLPRWLWPAPPPTRPSAATPAPRQRSSGASPYGLAALAAETDHLRRLPEGQRNHGLNRAAFCLGTLVAGGELAEDLVCRELLAAAQACGLGGREALRTLRSGLRAGAAVPRRAPVTDHVQ